MVENQHRRIKGYRDLTEDEIASMNQVKEIQEAVADLWRSIGLLPDIDRRAHALARTELQDGFMWLVRAVARPDDPFDRARPAPDAPEHPEPADPDDAR